MGEKKMRIGKERRIVVGWVERVMRILKMNEKVQELSVERTKNAG